MEINAVIAEAKTTVPYVELLKIEPDNLTKLIQERIVEQLKEVLWQKVEFVEVRDSADLSLRASGRVVLLSTEEYMGLLQELLLTQKLVMTLLGGGTDDSGEAL